MDGAKVYGTPCCFSHRVKEGVGRMDLQRLQMVARLLAEDLQQTEAGVQLELEPIADRGPPAANSGAGQPPSSLASRPSSSSGATGLVRWASKPASSALRTSCSCP